MGKKTETQRLITITRRYKTHFWLWFQCLTKWWNVPICNFGVCGGCFLWSVKRRLVKSSLINHVEENFGSVGWSICTQDWPIEDSLFSVFGNRNIHNTKNSVICNFQAPVVPLVKLQQPSPTFASKVALIGSTTPWMVKWASASFLRGCDNWSQNKWAGWNLQQAVWFPILVNPTVWFWFEVSFPSGTQISLSLVQFS